MHSLRLRLFTFLLVLAALAALAVAGATYRAVRAEADEFFDYQLQQMALSLRDQGRIAEEERAALANPAFDYVVQIWSFDGVLLYSSLPPTRVQPLPPRTVLGLSDVQLGEATWRVYGAATPLRIVQVGQPLVVRRQFAAAAAGRSVLPIAVATPLVALAMWWLVGFSLAPLQRVEAAVRQRDAASLEPLPHQGLPSELQPLVTAFNGLLAQLATAFEAQRAFVADAAHELRTPLTALKLQIGLLHGADDDTGRALALERLRAGVDRAAHLVEQLLALARAEPGHALPREEIDLVVLAHQALADAGAHATAKQATVTLDAPPALAWRGNAVALRGLLRNLLDNAILHGGDAPQVELRLRASADGGRLLQVDDNGPGIPPPERERVFDRFHRRQDGAGEGSGLGLAIARAVARQHGGRLVLGDAPAGGLRAELQLPPAVA